MFDRLRRVGRRRQSLVDLDIARISVDEGEIRKVPPMSLPRLSPIRPLPCQPMALSSISASTSPARIPRQKAFRVSAPTSGAAP